MTDGEGQFPLKDRSQEMRLAEILEEPEIMASAAGSSEFDSAADAVS